MAGFITAATKSLKHIIERYTAVISSELGGKGLIALYVGGTREIEDRNESSDIDFIGVVNDSFQEESEIKINANLAALRPELQIEAKLRELYMSEMSGGPQKGFIATCSPSTHFGPKYDFSKRQYMLLEARRNQWLPTRTDPTILYGKSKEKRDGYSTQKKRYG